LDEVEILSHVWSRGPEGRACEEVWMGRAECGVAPAGLGR
jgi:hypothetical protein